jgi:hypothetical protein
VALYRERIPPVYGRGTLEHPPSFLPSDAVKRAREWLDGSRRTLSIFGPSTASGKSTLAACVAASWAMRDKPIQWLHAVDLVDAEKAKHAFDTIRSAPFVVVDGCGKEFGNGRFDSFEADKPKASMLRLFTHVHESRGQRFVFTFDMHWKILWKEAYDAGLMRRIVNEEFAVAIALRRDGELRGMPIGMRGEDIPGGKAE